MIDKMRQNKRGRSDLGWTGSSIGKGLRRWTTRSFLEMNDNPTRILHWINVLQHVHRRDFLRRSFLLLHNRRVGRPSYHVYHRSLEDVLDGSFDLYKFLHHLDRDRFPSLDHVDVVVVYYWRNRNHLHEWDVVFEKNRFFKIMISIKTRQLTVLDDLYFHRKLP